MLARRCGQVVVVDEDVMSHAQLGNDNLLIVPDMTDGVLKVEVGHSGLVLGKELLHSLDGALHRHRIIRVHHREGLPPHVGVHYVMRGELPAVVIIGAGSAIGTTGCPRGCAYCVVW